MGIEQLSRGDLHPMTDSCWSSVPSTVLEGIWRHCVRVRVAFSQSPHNYNTYSHQAFTQVCKSWHEASGQLVATLWTLHSHRSTAPLLCEYLPHFSAVHTLQLRQKHIDGQHLQCCSSNLPLLRELCLPACFHHCTKLRRSDFAGLSQLTALHLHFIYGMNVRPSDLPDGMFQSLQKLQHITITGMYYGWAPFADMSCLPELKSFKTDRVHESMTHLTGLQELHITEELVFHLFEESFSGLARLTKLQVGSKFGTNKSDIMSLHAFSRLQTLVLLGPYKNILPGTNPGRLQRWDALTTLSTLQQLYLKDVDHVYGTFQLLGQMTQLTCLYFSSISPLLKPQALDASLMGLSSLTNLSRLICSFPCSAFQLMGQAHAPDSSVLGDLLKYSLSFCSPMCECQFGCKCTLAIDSITDTELSWCSRYRRYT